MYMQNTYLVEVENGQGDSASILIPNASSRPDAEWQARRLIENLEHTDDNWPTWACEEVRDVNQVQGPYVCHIFDHEQNTPW